LILTILIWNFFFNFGFIPVWDKFH